MAGSLLDEPLNSYDGMGNVRSCTYPGRRIVNSTYDRLNRLQMVTNFADLVLSINSDALDLGGLPVIISH